MKGVGRFKKAFLQNEKMKLFQNKFFLICLCVAVVLCAVPSTLSIMGYSGLAKNVIGTVTYPIRWCITAIGDGFEGIGRYFTGIDALSEQNQALKEENAALREEIARAERLEKENERLRAYLDMKTKYPELKFEEGMVIGHAAGNYMTGFTLNKGSLHGISVNMAVVVKEGIVGYVTEVGLNWCMVSTLIEDKGAVGAYVSRSGSLGMVSGDPSMKDVGECKMSYMNEDADIREGDVILSSGTGSVYPADLPIGTVKSVTRDEYNRTPIATVQPAVDFSSLQYMMIITGYVG